VYFVFRLGSRQAQHRKLGRGAKIIGSLTTPFFLFEYIYYQSFSIGSLKYHAKPHKSSNREDYSIRFSKGEKHAMTYGKRKMNQNPFIVNVEWYKCLL
jgi:hypothetical protein